MAQYKTTVFIYLKINHMAHPTYPHTSLLGHLLMMSTLHFSAVTAWCMQSLPTDVSCYGTVYIIYV